MITHEICVEVTPEQSALIQNSLKFKWGGIVYNQPQYLEHPFICINFELKRFTYLTEDNHDELFDGNPELRPIPFNRFWLMAL